MSKLHEMMGRLLVQGMRADNLPVGMMGGAKMESLKGIRMKCTKMTLFARMEGEQLIDFERFLPYGFLHVESPELRENTIVSVRHKLDFHNAWILQDKGLLDDETCELHVTYKRAGGLKKIFSGLLPHFQYTVFNYGIFDDLSASELLREFALEEKPIIRLYGHQREVNQD